MRVFIQYQLLVCYGFYILYSSSAVQIRHNKMYIMGGGAMGIGGVGGMGGSGSMGGMGGPGMMNNMGPMK